MKAVVIRSQRRFDTFIEELAKQGVKGIVMDFSDDSWMAFDYNVADFLIFYPTWDFSSNHPLSVYNVQDNLMHIHSCFPELHMYPDPQLIWFYNDKYRQFLYLKKHAFPIPRTIALLSEQAVDAADRRLGYPMVLKNRYGSGGESVFLIHHKSQLKHYFYLSKLHYARRHALIHLLRQLLDPNFYWQLCKAKRMVYPFLSPPLLAQEYIVTDRDLKTVVRDGTVVEGHWRLQRSRKQWKVNIDDGGIGRWSRIPEEAICLSERLARSFGATWINLDLIPSGERFVITEFSPVWHHYEYKEKDSFVYAEDYNIETPLRIGLELEQLIVRSLIDKVRARR